jgi:hypothetical protein
LKNPVLPAARRIGKMIDAHNAGDDIDNYAEAEHRIFVAINRLEDRRNKADIRGDDVLRNEADLVIHALRERARASVETSFEARRKIRNAEIAAIQERERDRIDLMSPRERETYNYQQELKISRGGR